MIREIKVKTALSPSKLPGLDYALNPGGAHMPVFTAMRRLLSTGMGNGASWSKPK